MNQHPIKLFCLLTLALGLLTACNPADPENPPSTDTGATEAPAITETEPDTEAPTETQPHVHTYGEWEVVKESTCTLRGTKERACPCGEVESERIPMLPHTETEVPAVEPTLSENGYSGGKVCSVCEKVLKSGFVLPYIGHRDLAYEVNPDGKTLTITGLGECTATDIYIPASLDGYTVTRIGTYAFGGQESLTGVHFPSTLTEIAEAAFYGCKGLTEVEIPYNVTSMLDSAFQNCSGLVKLELNARLTEISRDCFYGCSSLTEVTLPKTVRVLQWGCFKACTSLRLIHLPEGLEKVGICAFESCTSLTEMGLPGSVGEIGDLAYAGCTGLSHIQIPGDLRILGSWVFSGCTGVIMDTVTLPDSLHTLGDGFFSQGPHLSAVVVPNGLKFPDEDTFLHINGLTEIYYCGSQAQWVLAGYTIPEGVTVHYDYDPGRG